jgi:hypothetical protein
VTAALAALAACFFGCTSSGPIEPEPAQVRVERWKGEDPVLVLFRRVEREGDVEVQLAPGIQATDLAFGFLDRLPWREALEVCANLNRLRISEPGGRVLLLAPEVTSAELGSERARQSMRINVDVEDADLGPSEMVDALIEEAEREGKVEVRFAEGVDRSELRWGSVGSIPWREALEVFAKTNRLRITEPEAGVVVLSPE